MPEYYRVLLFSGEQGKVVSKCNALLLNVDPIYFVHKVEGNLFSENDTSFEIEFSCKQCLLVEKSFQSIWFNNNSQG